MFFVFFSLFILFFLISNGTRGIITNRCTTSARLWRPIMPRGVPRGHGIFYRSAKGQRNVSRSSLPYRRRFTTPLRGQLSWHSPEFFFPFDAIRKIERISKCQEYRVMQECVNALLLSRIDASNMHRMAFMVRAANRNIGLFTWIRLLCGEHEVNSHIFPTSTRHFLSNPFSLSFMRGKFIYFTLKIYLQNFFSIFQKSIKINLLMLRPKILKFGKKYITPQYNL